jgi:hypothetical protein
VSVVALVPASQSLPNGEVWVLTVQVQDDDGGFTAAAPTLTITAPNGTTTSPTMVDQGDGVWRGMYPLAAAGRHVARIVSAGYGAADLTVYATTLITATGMPDLATTKVYLGVNSFSDAEISDALNAESGAQRSVCRVPADYPDDLAQALKRRVARNLSLRKLPLAVLRGDSDGGDSTVVPGRDPEIRRLEGPFRKMPTG